MKKGALVLMSVLLTGIAHATCPELNGTFACEFKKGSVEDFVIESFKDPLGNMIYNINNNLHIIMNGFEIKLPDLEDQKDITIKGVCEKDAGVIVYKATLVEGKRTIGSTVSKTKLSMASPSSLVIREISLLKYTDREYNSDNVTVCRRVK